MQKYWCNRDVGNVQEKTRVRRQQVNRMCVWWGRGHLSSATLLLDSWGTAGGS